MVLACHQLSAAACARAPDSGFQTTVEGNPRDLMSFLSKNNGWAFSVSLWGKDGKRMLVNGTLGKRSPSWTHALTPAGKWVTCLAMMSQGNQPLGTLLG